MGAVPLSDEQRRARARRTRAARKFRPTKIDTLFVAEAPPATVDRYFYFEGVREQDSLFRNVCEGVLRHTPSREGKTEALAELQARGFFLIDLSPDPLDGQSLDALVPGLVRRCTRLDPRQIILIKANVYDLAFRSAPGSRAAGRGRAHPFPGSGRQREFLDAFRRALRS